jgi:hypothetical protein
MLMYVPKGKKGSEVRACCCRQLRGNAGVFWGCLLVVVPAGGICWWWRLLMVLLQLVYLVFLQLIFAAAAATGGVARIKSPHLRGARRCSST